MARVVEYQGMRVAVPYSYDEVEREISDLSNEEVVELAKGPLSHSEGCRLCKTLGYPEELGDGPSANLVLSAYHNCADITERPNKAPRYPNGLLATEAIQQARCFLIYALAACRVYEINQNDDLPVLDDLTVLGHCVHGVDLDKDFCPQGCRV